MLRIGKMYKFESAHYLPNHEGKCKNLHGHQWRVEIVLEGNLNLDENSPEFMMIIDFKRLNEIVDPIIEEYDHKLLNDLLYPTAENIAIGIAQRINKSITEGKLWLDKVRVWESDDSWAEWRRS